MRIFLDTNILIDVIGQREPFIASAARIWTMAEKKQLQVWVSAISFNNTYYIVRKMIGRDQTIKAMHLMRAVFHIVAVDERLIDQAITAGFDDFEDAIQYHCALRCRADALITRNIRHFPATPLKILTGEQFFEAYPEF